MSGDLDVTQVDPADTDALIVSAKPEHEKEQKTELASFAGSMSQEIRVLHECAVKTPRDPVQAVRTMLDTLAAFPALAELGTYAIPYKEHTDECKTRPWKERATCRCPVTWIRGPSVELMVPIATAFKNVIHGARLLPLGNETIVQGIFVDVENLNVVMRDRQVSRLKRKRDGSTFYLGQDEYWREVEIQASKMHRNAIKRGIPRYIWQPIYEAALDARLRREQADTVPSRWAAAVAKFSTRGVSEERLMALLGKDTVGQVEYKDLAHIGSLWQAAEAGLVDLRATFSLDDEPDGTAARATAGQRATTREET